MAIEYHGLQLWDKTSVLLRYAASRGFKAYSLREMYEHFLDSPAAPICVVCDGVFEPVYSTRDIDELAGVAS